MLFILTNSQDATVSFLTPFLERAGVRFQRLDTDALVPRVQFSYGLGNPALRLDGCWYEAYDATHIWYRRPEQLKDARFDGSPESNFARLEWTEFIECFFAHVPADRWVNHPALNSAASRKLEQLTTAARLGFRVPDTIVTQNPEDLQEFYRKHQGEIIVKPVSTGYVERPKEDADSLIYTNRVHDVHMERLDDLRLCPTLFQEFIKKRCDVRITVMDDDIHAVALIARERSGEQRCDVRRDNMSDVEYEAVALPQEVRNRVRQLLRHYKLRFGAIDMAVSLDGAWYFLEINPNGQWAWLDMTAGTNIASSFVASFAARKFTASCVCGTHPS